MLKSEVARKLRKYTCYCDICGKEIDAGDIVSENFEYSKTRRGDVWVHTICWNKLYGGKNNE